MTRSELIWVSIILGMGFIYILISVILKASNKPPILAPSLGPYRNPGEVQNYSEEEKMSEEKVEAEVKKEVKKPMKKHHKHAILVLLSAMSIAAMILVIGFFAPVLSSWLVGTAIVGALIMSIGIVWAATLVAEV